MHLKLLRAAAVVAVLGGTATFGLGSIQPALAATTNVDCSTADLISAMNSYTSGDTLVLAPHCTYWVTASLPSIMHTLTIQGNNASIVRTYSSDPFTILIVGCSGGNVTLSNLNFRNGGGDNIDGGAIAVTNSNAHLTVYGGTFKGNNANYVSGEGYGGAIYNLGTVTVSGATFVDNGAEYGGAIYSEHESSTATLNHDSFVSNDAYEGGAVYNEDNNMQINSGNFRYNTAVYGGAVYNDYNLTAFNTLFSMNSASDEGGAIYNEDNLTLNHSLIEVNWATDGGGGIYFDDGTVTLHFDQINQNSPDNCEPTQTIDGCVG